MAGRRKNKNFAHFSSVLSKVVNKYGIDQRLKEHTVMASWGQIVGEPWASLSRPLFFDYERNLVVAVRDGSCATELGFKKNDILTNLRAMGTSVGVKIKGIRFDLKSFSKLEKQLETEQIVISTDDLSSIEPSAEQLASIELDEAHLTELEKFKLGLCEEQSNSQLNDRICEIYERDLRRKIWLISKGFSLCNVCGQPDTRFYGLDSLCGQCFVESQLPSLT